MLEQDDRMAVWWGAMVEYVAALARREREGSLTPADVSTHCRQLQAPSQSCTRSRRTSGSQTWPGVRFDYTRFEPATPCNWPPRRQRLTTIPAASVSSVSTRV